LEFGDVVFIEGGKPEKNQPMKNSTHWLCQKLAAILMAKTAL